MSRISAKKRRYRSQSSCRLGDDAARLKRLTKAELIGVVSKLGRPPAMNGAEPCITAPPVPSRAPTMLVNGSVRSGQSVVFPDGDLIIVGSVGSGSEIEAGGSIHIYGALRGRAYAGSVGDTSSRIFCQRLEPELLAIAGVCRMSDDLDDDLRGRAAHAWLASKQICLAALVNPDAIQGIAAREGAESCPEPGSAALAKHAAAPRLPWASPLAWARRLIHSRAETALVL